MEEPRPDYTKLHYNLHEHLLISNYTLAKHRLLQFYSPGRINPVTDTEYENIYEIILLTCAYSDNFPDKFMTNLTHD